MDDHVETLRRYNRWRRGQDCEEMQDPRVVGDAIDAACDEIDRLRAELAEVRPDCRTCQHFYSDFDLGEAQCGFNNTGVGILCVAGDRHEPFDPVRLYAIDASMAGGE